MLQSYNWDEEAERIQSEQEFCLHRDKLKVKKLVPEAVLPTQAKKGDAGYDLVALDDGVWSNDRTYIEYSTGIAIEPPDGWHVEIFPRSSISKVDLVLSNSIGLIDNGYRGEIKFRFKHVLPWSPLMAYRSTPVLYKKGDKIGQMVLRKTHALPVVEVEALTETERGSGGFGSTDTK